MCIQIRDLKGTLMKIFLVTIVWYAFVVQFFFQIPNALLFLGGALALVVFWDIGTIFRKFYFLKTEILLILYVALTFLFGLFLSANIGLHISRGISTIEYCAIYLFICYYAKTRGKIDFLLVNYIVIYSLLVVYFLYNPAITSDFSEGIRYSFHPNANSNGFAIGICTCIWCVLYYIQKGKIKIWIGFALIILYSYVVLMTGSRKALIALIICVVLWLFLCYFKMNDNKFSSRKTFKVVLVLVIVAVVAMLLVPIYFNSTIGTRMSELITGSDQSTKTRINMYINGFKLALSSPIFGNGFDAYRNVYGAYAHSDFVEVLASSGFIISLLYFAIYVLLFVDLIRSLRSIKAIKRETNNMNYYLDVLCILIFLIMHIFYSIGVVHIQSLDSFINLGIICCLSYLTKEKTKKQECL